MVETIRNAANVSATVRSRGVTLASCSILLCLGVGWACSGPTRGEDPSPSVDLRPGPATLTSVGVPAFQGENIGGASGSETYDATNGTYTITGTGTGPSTTGDMLHFTYTTLPDADFALIAQVVTFTGGPGAQVGMLTRRHDTPTQADAGADAGWPGTAAGVYFALGGSQAQNEFAWVFRNTQPGAVYPANTVTSVLPVSPPF